MYILGLLIITVISPMGVLNYTITALKIKNDDVFYMPVASNSKNIKRRHC